MTLEPKNPFEIFAEIRQRIIEQTQPLAELAQRIQASLAPSQDFISKIVEFNEGYRRALDQMMIPLSEFSARVAELERQKRLLAKIGVLPHASTPVELLNDNSTAEELRLSFQDYYETNWRRIFGNINKRINNCGIDEEAKATLGEALQAHENGHYRAVSRMLFPEIERVVRVELRENAIGNIPMAKLMSDTADDLSIADLEPRGYFALALLERLTDHLYVNVITEDSRKKMEGDLVPNRHAAIHGLVVYNSYWNSLNAIFMTDFAFQIVSSVKKASSRESLVSNS
jgi:hypothetical protein